jgi:hypothetical protein
MCESLKEKMDAADKSGQEAIRALCDLFKSEGYYKLAAQLMIGEVSIHQVAVAIHNTEDESMREEMTEYCSKYIQACSDYREAKMNKVYKEGPTEITTPKKSDEL